MSMREQFEDWITTTGLDADLSRGNHGCYLNSPTHWLYCAWVASREPLVIEMPTEYDCCGGTTSYEIRDMAIEAVESAGLKVKK